MPFAEVVHDAAGGADDDVHAAPQRGQLHAVGLAAVDRQHVHAAQVRGVLLERLADLQGQLAGGGEHERLRVLLGQVETGQDRQRERRGLAGAGLGESDDVAAGQQRRNRGGLDGGGGLVADIADGLQHRVAESEVGEACGDIRVAVHRRGVHRQWLPRSVRSNQEASYYKR